MSQPPKRTSGIRPPSARSSLPVRAPVASGEAKNVAGESKATTQSEGLRPPSATTTLGKTSPQERTPPKAPASNVSPSHSTQSRSPQDVAEVSVLKAQNKDLSEKLETLMFKRKEDREKLLEYEKAKIQLQQLLEYKKQMTEAQSNLQKQLAMAKKEAKEAIEAKAQQADDIRELEEAAEMATLDKEMAEEKYEQAMKELEQTKEKLEEVTLDLEIMKNEIDNKGAVGEDGSAVTTYEVKQLQSQNEKLREAIIKLRDLSSEDKIELQKLIKEFEVIKAQNSELQKTKEKLQEEIRSYEAQVIDLKEQIDSALGSQEMIENLTEKNFKLEEDLAREVEDREVLEKLLETNELLLEQAKDTEQELLQEIDLHRGKLSEALVSIDQAKAVIEDRDGTIIKFRELVTNLKEENKRLESKTDDSHIARVHEQEHESSNIEFKIRLQEEKAKNLEMELKKAEESRVQEQYELKSKLEEIKSLNASLDEFKSKIEAKENEIHSLKRALKAKVEEASEHQIRRELAEKKLSTANKDADDRVVRMQNELDHLKAEMRRKEKEYEETMNHLQSDIESLESERGALKHQVKNLASSGSGHFDGSPKTPLSSRVSHSSPPTAWTAIDDQTVASLRRALTKLKAENDDLKMKTALKSLNLKPSSVNVTKPNWLLRMQGKENEIDQKSDKLNKVLNKVSNFQAEVHTYLTTKGIYDGSKDIQQQRRNDLVKQRMIVSRYREIEKMVRDFMDEYNEDWKVETQLDTKFVAPAYSKIAKEKAILAARLRIPCSKEVKSSENIQLEVTLDQLRSLHQRLLV